MPLIHTKPISRLFLLFRLFFWLFWFFFWLFGGLKCKLWHLFRIEIDGRKHGVRAIEGPKPFLDLRKFVDVDWELFWGSRDSIDQWGWLPGNLSSSTSLLSFLQLRLLLNFLLRLLQLSNSGNILCLIGLRAVLKCPSGWLEWGRRENKPWRNIQLLESHSGTFNWRFEPVFSLFFHFLRLFGNFGVSLSLFGLEILHGLIFLLLKNTFHFSKGQLHLLEASAEAFSAASGSSAQQGKSLNESVSLNKVASGRVLKILVYKVAHLTHHTFLLSSWKLLSL